MWGVPNEITGARAGGPSRLGFRAPWAGGKLEGPPKWGFTAEHGMSEDGLDAENWLIRRGGA